MVSLAHNTSLPKTILSRSRGTGTKKKLTQTTLVALDSPSSEVHGASSCHQLRPSRKVSSDHDSVSSLDAKEVQSVQVPLKKISNEIASSKLEGTVSFASKFLNLPKQEELAQHNPKPYSNQQVIIVHSDSEEEPTQATSTVVQPDSDFNIGCNVSRALSARPEDLLHSCDQPSALLHAGTKLYSLDNTESMCEGLSELRKMVDPHPSAQRHVIDLREGDGSSSSQSTGDSDGDGIPLMEHFANVRNPAAVQSDGGDAGKQAMSDSDSDDAPLQLYRSCHRKPNFLSLSEDDSESEEGKQSSAALAAERDTPKLKFYCVPVASGIHKPVVQVKDCQVVLHKCRSVQEDSIKLSSSVGMDHEKMSPSPMDISDSSIPDCNIQKDDKLSPCVIVNADALLPAGVSYLTKDMSPHAMDISDSNWQCPLQKTSQAEPSSSDGKATEQSKKNLQQVIENQQPLVPRQSENQCSAEYSNSVQARSAVLSPTASGTTVSLHSPTLPGKQMPVATVSPMGFPMLASSHHSAQSTEQIPEPPKRKQLLPARKVQSNRRKVPTFESCQAQFLRNPNDYNCAPERNADLLSTIMASSSSDSKQASKGMTLVPSAKVPPATSAVSVTVNRVITKPKVPFRMNDFHTRVLSWDPQLFLYPQESDNRQLICPSPAWFPANLTVPLVFQSVDQYCQVFSPLLLIEVWEEVSCNI